MDIERTQIQPEALATAAAQSAATASARAPRTIASPPLDAAGSPVDVAAVAAAATIQSALAVQDMADVAAVTKQTACLTESPPALVQQDQDNAADITRAAQFPIPTMAPPDSGKVWSV